MKICRKVLAPIAYPKVVGSWHNARDRRDVVALYPLDASHFPIDPVVANYDGVWNRTPNAHGIGGYVNDARVLDVLHRALVVL